MIDQKKEGIIFLLVFFAGSALFFIFYKHTKYAVSLFLCFPLGLYFLLRKTASYGFAVPLGLIPRLIGAFLFIGLGIYGILYVNNIVPQR
jgi:hypothetical protein